MLTASVELKVKYNLATELRDNIDGFCVGASYAIFLKKLVPVFMKLLEGPPVFTSTSWEQVRAQKLDPHTCGHNTDHVLCRGYETAFWRSSTDCL